MHVLLLNKKYERSQEAKTNNDGMIILVYFFMYSEVSGANMLIEEVAENLQYVRKPHTSQYLKDMLSVSDMKMEFEENFFMYSGCIKDTFRGHPIVWVISRNCWAINQNQMREFRRLEAPNGYYLDQKHRDVFDDEHRIVYHVRPDEEVGPNVPLLRAPPPEPLLAKRHPKKSHYRATISKTTQSSNVLLFSQLEQAGPFFHELTSQKEIIQKPDSEHKVVTDERREAAGEDVFSKAVQQTEEVSPRTSFTTPVFAKPSSVRSFLRHEELVQPTFAPSKTSSIDDVLQKSVRSSMATNISKPYSLSSGLALIQQTSPFMPSIIKSNLTRCQSTKSKLSSVSSLSSSDNTDEDEFKGRFRWPVFVPYRWM